MKGPFASIFEANLTGQRKHAAGIEAQEILRWQSKRPPVWMLREWPSEKRIGKTVIRMNNMMNVALKWEWSIECYAWWW